jgi:hypothetical protein
MTLVRTTRHHLESRDDGHMNRIGERIVPELSWISRLVVPGRTLTGAATQAIVGVLETSDGPRRALLIGHDTDPVLLPRQAMAEFISHCRGVMVADIPEDRAGR